MARPARFERATCGFEARRQNEGTSRAYALCDPDLILFDEAVALLALARDGKAVEAERADRFARAVVEATALGRAAMAVFDGGLFAGARLAELAEAIADRGADRPMLAASRTPNGQEG